MTRAPSRSYRASSRQAERPPAPRPRSPERLPAGEDAPSVTTLPLRQLALSLKNVRHRIPPGAVKEMAESIAAHGVLQNLIVSPAPAGAVTHQVDAGGLRYRGLLELLAHERIDGDYPVPVRVKPLEDASVISHLENVKRWAMTPAEEIRGYAAILADHPGEPDRIAFLMRRFGRTRDYIAQRLRLAGLPDPILDALDDGTIGLPAAQAYAAVDDADVQLHAFDVERRRTIGDAHRPQNIRDTMFGRTVPASDPRVLYLGLDAYIAAGGRTSRDLFMLADAGEQLHDRALLDRLVREKAEAALPAEVARHGYGAGVLMDSLTAAPKWPAPPKGYRHAGRVADTATMSALPAHVVRPTAIGIYALAGHGLSAVGWFTPIAAPAAPPPDNGPPAATPAIASVADAPPDPPPSGSVGARIPAGPSARSASAPIGGGARPGDRLREQALRLTAARITIDDLMGAGIDLSDRACWPNAKHGFVPPIDTAIGDDDTYLVAIQLRVTRAELEAMLPEAEHALDADADANDRVLAAEGDPDAAARAIDGEADHG